MSTTLPSVLLRLEYEKAAEAYLRSLPPEHFMEATPQATQREITLESFALLKAQRPDLYYFNELLVQYPHGKRQQKKQVVPDNMVVLSSQPIQAKGSYDLPFQPVGPFWMLEYVSKSSERKDYDDSFRKYERHLKVPYYLPFYPEIQDLTLFQHNGKKYVSKKPGATGRYVIEELELELGVLEGWTRFWYRGQLLPLPADLQRALTEAQLQLQQKDQQLQQKDEQLQQKDEQLDQERQKNAQLLAKLRAHGIEPNG